MYLTGKYYCKNWEFQSPEEKHHITVRLNGHPIAGLPEEKICYVEFDVAYWRKANAIHQWFVKNCQAGNDDCSPHYVDREQLQELLDTVNRVLAGSELVKAKIKNGERCTPENGWEDVIVDGKTIRNPAIATELLPTQEGFFFGSTDYNQYYYQDLKDTKGQLEEALKLPDGIEFYYHSSW